MDPRSITRGAIRRLSSRYRCPPARHNRRRAPHPDRRFRRPAGSSSCCRSVEKAVFFHQIARRIAVEGKFRKHNDFRASRDSFPRRPDHAVRVAAQVTYSGIELSERNSHPVDPILRDHVQSRCDNGIDEAVYSYRVRIGELAFAQGTAPSPASQRRYPSPVSAGSPAGRRRRASAPAVAPDKVVLTVGDRKDHRQRIRFLYRRSAGTTPAQARGPLKRQMADQIVRVKAALAAGEKRRPRPGSGDQVPHRIPSREPAGRRGVYRHAEESESG